MTLPALQFLFETPADGGGGAVPGGVTSVPVPEPATPAPSAPEPSVTAPAAGTAPWSAALERRFTDPAQRSEFDAFLREEVQPYVTRREQELGEANRLYTNLMNEEMSVATFLSTAEQLYGPEMAGAMAQAMIGQLEGTEGAPPAATDGPSDEEAFQKWYDSLPPEAQRQFDEREAQRQDDDYNAFLTQIGEEIPSIKGREAYFSTYVAAAEGNVDHALAQWAAMVEPALAQHPELFLDNPGEAAAPAVDPAAAATAAAAAAAEVPDVLGSSTVPGGVTPPQVPANQSLEEAVHDFLHIDLAPRRSNGLT